LELPDVEQGRGGHSQARGRQEAEEDRIQVKLRGGRELRARLAAMERAKRPVTRTWATETARAMRPMVPVKTGALRRSIDVGHTSEEEATVVANSSAFFVDAGTRPHDIEPRRKPSLVFQGKRGTVFARKVHHRGSRAQPFRARAAREGLRRTRIVDFFIGAWNRAA
jgi:hypothetical protein